MDASRCTECTFTVSSSQKGRNTSWSSVGVAVLVLVLHLVVFQLGAQWCSARVLGPLARELALCSWQTMGSLLLWSFYHPVFLYGKKPLHLEWFAPRGALLFCLLLCEISCPEIIVQEMFVKWSVFEQLSVPLDTQFAGIYTWALWVSVLWHRTSPQFWTIEGIWLCCPFRSKVYAKYVRGVCLSHVLCMWGSCAAWTDACTCWGYLFLWREMPQ